MALGTSFDAINSNSVNVALTAATAAQVIGALGDVSNYLRIQADPANTTPVYLLLGSGVPSATNWHVALPAGAVWSDGVGYRGAVQAFSTAAARVSAVVY